MQGKKLVVTLIVVLFISCVGYIGMDCFRLTMAEPGTKPLITIDVVETANQIEYKGLGYSVSYRYEDMQISGAELWLFDSIFIWGYISCR